MTSVSVGHTLTSTHTLQSGRPERESNPRLPLLTKQLLIVRAATHETELGDHDFCLSRSHYTDTDPTNIEWAGTAASEPTRSHALYRMSYRAP